MSTEAPPNIEITEVKSTVNNESINTSDANSPTLSEMNESPDTPSMSYDAGKSYFSPDNVQYKDTYRSSLPYTDEEVYNLFKGYSLYGDDFALILSKLKFQSCRKPSALSLKFKKLSSQYPNWRKEFLDQSLKTIDEEVMLPPLGGIKRREAKLFTKREVKHILRGVTEMNQSWKAIHRLYHTVWKPGRKPFHLKRKYEQIKDDDIDLESEDDDDEIYHSQKDVSKKTRFSKKEVLYLTKGIKKYGFDWDKILEAFPFRPERTTKSLQHKYYRNLRNNLPRSKSFVESENLDHVSIDTVDKIEGLSTVLENATKVSRNPFSNQEIKYIAEGIQEFGQDWKRIAQHYPFKKGRTAVAIQNKFFSLHGKNDIVEEPIFGDVNCKLYKFRPRPQNLLFQKSPPKKIRLDETNK